MDGDNQMVVLEVPAKECPKCQYLEASVRHHSGWLRCLWDRKTSGMCTDEHLHMKCRQCGYQWAEVPGVPVYAEEVNDEPEYITEEAVSGASEYGLMVLQREHAARRDLVGQEGEECDNGEPGGTHEVGDEAQRRRTYDGVAGGAPEDAEVDSGTDTADSIQGLIDYREDR
jgi:hypothetical protein